MISKMLRQLRERLVGLWYGVDNSRAQAESEALQEKLQGLTWQTSEDEASAERQVSGHESRGDPLGETVFRGRPSNPLAGED